MFVMIQKLYIGNLIFNSVSDVTVSSSLYEPVDTMTIKLPLDRSFDRDKIKVGDSVEWEAGYEKYGLFHEFKGEITEISPKTSDSKPLEIICKDMMYKAQKVIFKKNTYRKTLENVLGSVASSIGIPSEKVKIIPDSIKNKRVSIYSSNKSIRWLLTSLKRYGYFAFFRSGKLYCVSITELSEFPEPSVFKIGFNVIEDKLINRYKTDIQVIVKSYNEKSGKIYEAKYPTKSKGESKEYVIDGLTNSEARKRAKDLYIEIAGDGMRGSFITFGYPNVSHSEIIQIMDPFNQDRNKEIFIGKVVKTFNAERAQFRQEIFPDIINFKKDVKKKKRR